MQRNTNRDIAGMKDAHVDVVDPHSDDVKDAIEVEVGSSLSLPLAGHAKVLAVPRDIARQGAMVVVVALIVCPVDHAIVRHVHKLSKGKSCLPQAQAAVGRPPTSQVVSSYAAWRYDQFCGNANRVVHMPPEAQG